MGNIYPVPGIYEALVVWLLDCIYRYVVSLLGWSGLLTEAIHLKCIIYLTVQDLPHLPRNSHKREWIVKYKYVCQVPLKRVAD